MADQAARTKDEIKPRSPLKSKVVRSQKISQTPSPSTALPAAIDFAISNPNSTSRSHPKPGESPQEIDDNDYRNEAQDRAAPIPRSHTPGHLASKSQVQRRRPSELSLRQRSRSAAATAAVVPPSTTSSVPPTILRSSGPSTTSLSLSLTSKQTRESGEGSTEAQAAPQQQTRPQSAAGGKDGIAGSNGTLSRRPTNLRSTSAIVSKPGSAPGSGTSSAGGGGERTASGTGSVRQASSNATSRTPTSAAPRTNGQVYKAFPPLADARTAPDVPPAPSSGMYWSRAPVSGHPHTAFRAHTTTLVGSNVYVFGGCDSRACFNELYVLDADAFYWSAPFVSGEMPVPLRAMTCTAVGKKLVIFGGGDGPAYYNDIYILDTVNFRWSRPRIVGDRAPSKRRAHTACLYKNGIYVFGGGDGVRALNDIWRLDVSDITKMSWKLISGPTNEKTPATGKDARPKARGYHTANMVGSKLIIFGGSDGGECFNDVWVYDVDTHVWKSVSIPLTFRRLSHTATIVGSYLFVIGGHDGNEYSNDVLLLNLVTMTWDKRKVYGLPPSGRGYHGTVLYDSRLMMIGGFDGSEVFGDVWILELAVHAYYSQISHFSIEV